VNFKPVLRRPRQAWRIPAIACSQILDPVAPQSTRRLILWEGTTPEGREIFRRILMQTSNLSQSNKDTGQVIAEVETRLGRFPELHAEFLLIFSRLCGQGEPTGELPLRDLATLIVLRTCLEQARAADPNRFCNKVRSENRDGRPG
jgi:hypothetical protein